MAGRLGLSAAARENVNSPIRSELGPAWPWEWIWAVLFLWDLGELAWFSSFPGWTQPPLFFSELSRGRAGKLEFSASPKIQEIPAKLLCFPTQCSCWNEPPFLKVQTHTLISSSCLLSHLQEPPSTLCLSNSE